MTETSAENETCKVCGVDVRPQAAFCYNCGAAVSRTATPIEAISALEEKSEITHVFGEKITVEKKFVRENVAESQSEGESKLTKPEIAETDETTEAERKIGAPQEQAKMQSAAALRRKSKSLERKTVEVVWEEHDSAPNVWFIAVAVFLSFVAAVILYLAMYLK